MEDLYTLIKTGSPREIRSHISETHPVNIAEFVGAIKPGEEQLLITLMAMLSDRQLAEVLEQLEPKEQLRVVDHIPLTRLRSLVQFISPDELADFLRQLDGEIVRVLLDVLPDRQTIQELMAYPETSAGGIMTTDFLSFRAQQRCGEVLNFYRRLAREVEAAYYIYVTDDRGRLVGVASLRDLVLADPEKPLGDIASSAVIAVTALMDQEEVSNVMRHYDFLALPVIDDNYHLLGVITFDDIIDVIEQEYQEDIQRMGGMEPTDVPYLHGSVWSVVRRRALWLAALFGAQMITGNILNHFQGYIEAVVVLAFFIPLLIDTGGNAGAQAASSVIRALALDEISISRIKYVIWKEMRTGLILGSMMALIAFFQASWLGGSPLIGYTVATALFIIVIMASILGGILPLIANRLRVDPAAASAPVVTTIVDGTGLIIYFLVARWILNL